MQQRFSTCNATMLRSKVEEKCCTYYRAFISESTDLSDLTEANRLSITVTVDKRCLQSVKNYYAVTSVYSTNTTSNYTSGALNYSFSYRNNFLP